MTPRLFGYALAGLGELAVLLAVLRRPTRDGLLLGLAASVLVAFCFLTTMHERYLYGAVIFLAAATLGRVRAAAVGGAGRCRNGQRDRRDPAVDGAGLADSPRRPSWGSLGRWQSLGQQPA